jgi:hypothetical protein
MRGLALWFFVPAAAIMAAILGFGGYFDALSPAAIRRRRPMFLLAGSFISMQEARLELARSMEDLIAVIKQTLVEFRVLECAMITVDEEKESPGGDCASAAPERGSRESAPPASQPVAAGEGAKGRVPKQPVGFEWMWTRPPDVRARYLIPLHATGGDIPGGGGGSQLFMCSLELSDRPAWAYWKCDSMWKDPDAAADAGEMLRSFMERALRKMADLCEATAAEGDGSGGKTSRAART